MWYALSKSARLPYSFIKGSDKQRQALSGHYMERFYNSIALKFSKGNVSVEELKTSFREALPANVAIQFRNIGKSFHNYDYNYDGYTSYMVRGKNRKIAGYVVYLPLDESNKYLDIKHSSILFHELRHVFDFLTQPKTLTRGTYVPKNLQTYYSESIYSNGKIKLENMEERVNNKIKRRPYYRRVDFLQNSRIELQGEINAFEAENYFNRLQKAYPTKIFWPKRFDDIQFFKLREKLAIIENMLKKELLALRKENKELYG